MSIKRISAVWDQSTSKGNARLLMLALADSANDDGYCWPGYDHIQIKMACGSRGTICNAIEDRENAQELIVDHRPNQGNKYLVIVGFSPEQVKHGLSTYFGMDETEVEATYQALKERGSIKNQTGNKSKKRTNAISPKSVLNKSKKRTGASLKTVLDPSLPIKETSDSDPNGSGAVVPKPVQPHIAIIDAYWAGLPGGKPVGEDYPRHVTMAAALHKDKAIVAEDVTRFMDALYDPETTVWDFKKWHNRPIPLEEVIKLLPVWLVNNPPPKPPKVLFVPVERKHVAMGYATEEEFQASEVIRLRLEAERQQRKASVMEGATS